MKRWIKIASGCDLGGLVEAYSEIAKRLGLTIELKAERAKRGVP